MNLGLYILPKFIYFTYYYNYYDYYYKKNY